MRLAGASTSQCSPMPFVPCTTGLTLCTSGSACFLSSAMAFWRPGASPHNEKLCVGSQTPRTGRRFRVTPPGPTSCMLPRLMTMGASPLGPTHPRAALAWTCAAAPLLWAWCVRLMWGRASFGALTRPPRRGGGSSPASARRCWTWYTPCLKQQRMVSLGARRSSFPVRHLPRHPLWLARVRRAVGRRALARKARGRCCPPCARRRLPAVTTRQSSRTMTLWSWTALVRRHGIAPGRQPSACGRLWAPR